MFNPQKQMLLFSSLCTNAEEIKGAEHIDESNIRDFIKKRLDYELPKTPYRLVRSEDLCMNSDKYSAIDEDICDAVLDFNRAGYQTKYCCQGHRSRSKHSYEGYIFFHRLPQDRKKTLQEKFTMLSFGTGFISFDSSFGEDTLIVRFSPISDSEESHRKLLNAISKIASSL